MTDETTDNTEQPLTPADQCAKELDDLMKRWDLDAVSGHFVLGSQKLTPVTTRIDGRLFSAVQIFTPLAGEEA